MSAYFLIRDKRELGAFAMGLVPRRWRGELRRVKGEIIAGLIGFIRAQSVLIVVSAALSITGLSLFGYRYAWLLGLLAGIFDLVPMVGPSAVFAPLVVYGIMTSDWTRAAGVAAVWGTVLVLRQVIEPEVVGRRVGLHPLTSVVAVYLGSRAVWRQRGAFGSRRRRRGQSCMYGERSSLYRAGVGAFLG